MEIGMGIVMPIKRISQLYGKYRHKFLRYKYIYYAFRSRYQLRLIKKADENTTPNNSVICFCVIKNERSRLPYFLSYYRKMGITHFVFIDNNSNDGGQAYLTKQSDCSIWFTKHSYKKSRFGMDWVNYLLAHYGLDKWCLVVDADEFLVYPFHDVRPIQALTNWLDASRKRTFGTTMLDMYAKGKIKHNIYSDGDDPLEKSNWFDAGNYIYSINQRYKNLWIQGGPRMRVFFKGNPKLAPALNKIPLVKWKKGYIYASSTHMLLPRKLNITYNKMGGEEISGALLHFKFSNVLLHKIKEEKSLKQHYLDGVEYKSYDKHDAADLNLWTPYSEKYTGWYQLEDLGLISKGGWA